MITAAFILKLALITIGASGALASYRGYRRRHADPALPRDPGTDRLWRVAAASGTVVVLDLAIVLGFHNTVGLPRWLAAGLFGILAAAVLVLFTAAILLGWRVVR